MRWIVLLCLATLFAQPAAAQEYCPGRIIRVNPAASGGGNGSSWAAAMTSLGGALAAAQPGDEIWLVSGVYSPGGTNPIEATFLLKRGVRLRGDFAGTETVASQRGPATGEPSTVLSGGSGADITSYAANVVTVVDTGLEDTCSTLIERVSIRNGRAVFGRQSNLSRVNSGGGINAFIDVDGQGGDSGREIYLESVWFRNNWATSTGGGAHIVGYSTTLTNCAFSNNFADGRLFDETAPPPFLLDGQSAQGGGLFVARASTVKIDRSSFTSNTSVAGGGIYLDAQAVEIAESSVTENAATSYGGIVGEASAVQFVSSGGAVKCSRVQFLGNAPCQRAVVDAVVLSNVQFRWCLFKNNGGFDDPYARSDAVLAVSTNFDGPRPRIHNCRFERNASRGTGSQQIGGAVFIRGTEVPPPTSITPPAEFVNCVFAGNVVGKADEVQGFGGALGLVANSSVRVINCTIVGNRAEARLNLPGRGAGIYLAPNCKATVWNTIFWDLQGQGAPPCGTVDGWIAIDTDGSNPAIYESKRSVYPPTFAASGICGVGPDNEFGDPFLSSTLTLTPDSTICIDRGNNCAVPPDALDVDYNRSTFERVPVDLGGQARFTSAGTLFVPAGNDDPSCLAQLQCFGQQRRIDIGAYEFQVGGTSDYRRCRADFDGNGVSDILDIFAFLDAWFASATPPDLRVDFTCDGVVDILDIFGFLGAWFNEVCPPNGVPSLAL